jgi:chromate reductase
MDERPIRLLGFAGSLRVGSYNRGLLRAALDVLPDGTTLDIFDLNGIPPYNMDLETERWPESVMALKDEIAGVDALLIATPEHNYSFPGVLKNTIDWVSRPFDDSPFEGKPVALMGASTSRFGTSRAQAAIRPVLAAVNCHVMVTPELFVPLSRDKFDADGNLADEKIRARVGVLLEALVKWTKRLRQSCQQDE